MGSVPAHCGVLGTDVLIETVLSCQGLWLSVVSWAVMCWLRRYCLARVCGYLWCPGQWLWWYWQASERRKSAASCGQSPAEWQPVFPLTAVDRAVGILLRYRRWIILFVSPVLPRAWLMKGCQILLNLYSRLPLFFLLFLFWLFYGLDHSPWMHSSFAWDRVTQIKPA